MNQTNFTNSPLPGPNAPFAGYSNREELVYGDDAFDPPSNNFPNSEFAPTDYAQAGHDQMELSQYASRFDPSQSFHSHSERGFQVNMQASRGPPNFPPTEDDMARIRHQQSVRSNIQTGFGPNPQYAPPTTHAGLAFVQAPHETSQSGGLITSEHHEDPTEAEMERWAREAAEREMGQACLVCGLHVVSWKGAKGLNVCECPKMDGLNGQNFGFSPHVSEALHHEGRDVYGSDHHSSAPPSNISGRSREGADSAYDFGGKNFAHQADVFAASGASEDQTFALPPDVSGVSDEEAGSRDTPNDESSALPTDASETASKGVGSADAGATTADEEAESAAEGASTRDGSDEQVSSDDDSTETKLVGPPNTDKFLSKLGKFKYFYGSEEAEECILKLRHKVVVEGDDVEDVKLNKRYWAKRLNDAMKKLPADNPGYLIFNTISHKGYDPDYFEARARHVVDRVILLHEAGSELTPAQLGRKSIEQCKASTRLELLADMFLNKKSSVKDVLDGWKIDLHVAVPSSSMKRATATAENNARKRQKLNTTRDQLKGFLDAAKKGGNDEEPEDGAASDGKVSGEQSGQSKKRANPARKSAASTGKGSTAATAGDEESDSDVSSEGERPQKKRAKTTSKKTPFTRKGGVARKAPRKNVPQASDTDTEDDGGASQVRQRATRASSARNVTTEDTSPPQGRRVLRNRKV